MIENNTIKTPYFLIKKEELDASLAHLNCVLKEYWSNYIIGYSFKTNSLPWILNYFKENGCYAEIVSDDEYLLAKEVGYAKERFIYNGIIKSRDTFLEAIKSHAVVNIDSDAEIDWLNGLEGSRLYSVGIRVNFDIEGMCPGQSQEPKEGGRFGFCYENGELGLAISRIRSTGIRLAGLHLHVSSKTRGVEIYAAIAKMAVRIAREYNLTLDYIDIGGGFFGGLPDKPQFEDYLDSVRSILSDYFQPENTRLIVEPGMALIGAPVQFITSVIDVKKTTYNRFAVIDGSRTNIDPLMTKSFYFCEVLRKETNRENISKQVIAGFTCMEHDRLYIEYNQPEIKPGDNIIFKKVGAYTMCLSPLFIKFFPSVYVDDGTEIRSVRERWTSKEVMQNSCDEAFNNMF